MFYIFLRIITTIISDKDKDKDGKIVLYIT